MEVSPATLEFKGSFTKQSTQFLSLTNTTNGPLAFKVKTTAPKLYCVRPNASIIQPGGTAQISIILQGFAQPLSKDYKCKDKFLLVSLPCPELYDSSKVGESWSELESKYKTDVVSKKLRVNYIITDDDSDYSNGAGNVPAGNDAAQLNHRSSDFSGVNEKFAAGPTASQTNGGSNAFSSGNSHNDNAFGGDSSNGSSGFAGISTGSAAAGLAAAGAAGAAGAGILAHTNQAPDLQRELDSSSAQVNNLAQRLDSNAGFGGQQLFQQQPQQQQQQQPPTPQQQYQQSADQSFLQDQYQQPPQQQYQQPPQQYQQQSPQQQYQQPPQQQYQQPPQQDYQQRLQLQLSPSSQYKVSTTTKEKKPEAKVEEPVNGISLPLAIALMIIAFLLGWLVF